jgi:hypothetical protein
MDYLNDGIVTLDKSGRVAGSNPAAASLLGAPPPKDAGIRETFPFVPEPGILELLDPSLPHEAQFTVSAGDHLRTLRLRSQPSEDMILIFISDVTSLNAQTVHNRQIARLQLIGQIARGVAHDFNNLLCVIAGHASILKHLPPGSPQLANSVDQIVQGTEKGTALAGHLLDLGQFSPMQPTDTAHEYVEMAVQTVRDTLSDQWTIDADITPLPTVTLTGIQIEQTILNLALLCADSMPEPGKLKITARGPDKESSISMGAHCAAVILVAAAPASEGESIPSEPSAAEPTRESGVILSVIRSVIEEAGGRLDVLRTVEGYAAYRVTLTHGRTSAIPSASGETTTEFGAYLSHWSVLLATTGVHRHTQELQRRLEGLHASIQVVQSVVTALALVEQGVTLDAVILEKSLLRQEAEGLLRAIVKLRPTAGIVVLSDDPAGESKALRADVTFVNTHSDPDTILLAMIESKSLAIRRKHAKPPAPR